MSKARYLLMDFTCAAALSTSTGAFAEQPQFHFAVTGASDYIFRGVSQTENDPAIFGLAKVSYKQLYATAGMENVNFHSSIDAEYDLSAGWTPSWSGFNFDLGVIRYGYVDQNQGPSLDTVELKGVASHSFGPLTLGAGVHYTWDYFGTRHDGVYYEGDFAYAITHHLSASGAFGHQYVSAGQDHNTWNIGATYAFTKNVAFDLRYADTDEHRLGKTFDSHVVAALTLSF